MTDVVVGVPNSMRTEAGERVYQQAKLDETLVPLYKETALERWDDWILVENRFPYDLVFTTHHLLVPTRDFADRDGMMKSEQQSLSEILNYLQHQYDIVFENTPRQRSVKSLYHIHLAVWKKRKDVTHEQEV